jgi:hypothetical protein
VLSRKLSEINTYRNADERIAVHRLNGGDGCKVEISQRNDERRSWESDKIADSSVLYIASTSGKKALNNVRFSRVRIPLMEFDQSFYPRTVLKKSHLPV